jgi:hypothetical protein
LFQTPDQHDPANCAEQFDPRANGKSRAEVPSAIHNPAGKRTDDNAGNIAHTGLQSCPLASHGGSSKSNFYIECVIPKPLAFTSGARNLAGIGRGKLPPEAKPVGLITSGLPSFSRGSAAVCGRETPRKLGLDGTHFPGYNGASGI